MSSDILVHHGVKGMRWGVRKAERNARLASRFEAKAESSRSAKNASQAKLDHYNSRQSKKASSYNRQKLLEWQEINARASKNTEKWEKHAQARREGRMDPTAKKFAIGATVVGGIMAANVAYSVATAKDRKVFDTYFGEYARGHKVFQKKYNSIYNSNSRSRISDAAKARLLFDTALTRERYRLVNTVGRTVTGDLATDKRIPKAVKKFEKMYSRGIRPGYGY